MVDRKRRALGFMMASLLALFAAGFAAPAMAGKPQVYSADGIVAIKGSDVVAYFTQGKAVSGKSKFTHTWNGKVWRFATAANRDRFRADPERYAPQYGGYCAYAVGNGYTAKIEPEAWSIAGGKLYLNYSLSVRALWSQRKRHYIAQGNRNWPGVLDK